MFSYSQSTGRCWRSAFAGAEKFEAVGYSGYSSLPWPLPPGRSILPGEGRNLPNMQNVSKIGPLPRGIYTIGPAYNHPKLGPCTMDLTPDKGNQMFGRDAMRCHGDSIENPGTASEGCICLPRVARLYISAARLAPGEDRIEVTE
jgi:hypothetical protein